MITRNSTFQGLSAGVAALLLLCLCNGCRRESHASTVEPVPVLQMQVIPRTPERLARGKYLVEGLLQCYGCHSEPDFTQRPEQPVAGKKGGGFIFPNVEVGLPEPNRVVRRISLLIRSTERAGGRTRTLYGCYGRGLVMMAGHFSR